MTTINIGATSFEIHGTVAGFKTFAAGRLDSAAYDAATSNQRKQALVMAAQRFEQLRWTGDKTVSTQTIPFPRDGATCDGVAVPDGTTPTNVINGEYAFALALLSDPSLATTQSQGTLLKRAKGGSAEVEFFAPSAGTVKDTPVPEEAFGWIKCYLASQSTFSAPTVSGDDCSSFDSRANLGSGYP